MKNYKVYLLDMLAYAQEAGDIARTKNNDRIRRLALERTLIIIAEAAKKIPKELRFNYPMVPWQNIIELRNIISHGYDMHTLDELEKIATNEVQELISILQNLIAQYQE